MFKRAFEKFLDKTPSKPDLYPYIYSINFKGLKTKAKKKITTEPIKCNQCGAILTNITLIHEDASIGTNFKCQYCGTINVISVEYSSEILPDDIDFLIEDIEPKHPKEEDQITKVGAIEGELYISVIDISGSMSGGKIEAVKKSLVQTIKDFKMNAPETKYLLIAFESSVYYYLRHNKEPSKFTGDLLFSVEGMKAKLGDSLKEKISLGSIGEFADGWVRVVENLNSMDMTALGPALFFAISSFETFQCTGRITLLTDGLANQGIGNLSGTSINAEKFYDKMADTCNQNNIIVDVVGVSAPGDNNEMGLQTLGKLTDKTGGKLYLISSSEMEEIFTELRQAKYIGKDVKIKVITPTSINIKNITGAFSSKSVKESEINLGAITEERELYVEIDSASKGFKERINDEVPIQLQVEYKDNEGRKRLRVINDKVKVTSDENELKAKYDQKLNVMMNIQSAGTDYYAGKGKSSKERLKKLKSDMVNEMAVMRNENISGFCEDDYVEGIDYLNDELEEMDMEMEKAENAPKASFMATKGQTRTRLSQEDLKKRMKRKGKK